MVGCQLTVSDDAAVCASVSSVWFGTQVHWLMSGERLERAVSASVGYDLADEVGSKGEGGCSVRELCSV